MRTTTNYMRTALFTMMLFAVVSLQAQSFEGTISMTTTNTANSENAQVEWLVKNGNHKLIVNGTADGKSVNYAILFLAGSSSAQLVSDIGGKASVFAIPESSFQGQGAQFAGATINVSDAANQIAGFSAKRIDLTSSSGSATVWVSNDVNIKLSELPAAINKGGLVSALTANGISGFPVKIEVKDAEGKTSFTQTVSAIKATPISLSEFSLEGFTDGATLIKESVEKQ